MVKFVNAPSKTFLAIKELQSKLGQFQFPLTFTLANGVVTTTVTITVITSLSVILWEPTSATAAAQVVNLYVSSQSAGSSFTLTHAAVSVTTQTFQYIVVG